jgi:DNA-directed RNA polymerase specialized sigma24 family protein
MSTFTAKIDSEFIKSLYAVAEKLARKLRPRESDRDDVVQAMVLAGERKRGRFDPARGSREQFVYVVMYSAALGEMKRLSRQKRLGPLFDDEKHRPIAPDDPYHHVVLKRLSEDIQASAGARAYRALVLKASGVSGAEVDREVGPGSARRVQRLQQALRKRRKRFERQPFTRQLERIRTAA